MNFKPKERVQVQNKWMGEAVYKELPPLVTGYVLKDEFENSSKVKIIVDGFTNRKSKYGCYYFPRCKINRYTDKVDKSDLLKNIRLKIKYLYSILDKEQYLDNTLRYIQNLNVQEYLNNKNKLK